MRTLTLIAVLAAALVFAAPAAASPSVTVKSSRYGPILFDGRGFVLYAFTADSRNRSNCYGACATAWPPYIVKSGVKGPRLGTTKRRDGSLQLTYAGRPLYYYVGDRAPGQILCQNVTEFGGVWLVVRGNGTLVR
jgi:predicted lipoprotein with Yx(FWY)xxD motif